MGARITIVRLSRTLGLFCLATLPARAVIERVVERTFPLQAVGATSLEVETFYGGIKVVTTEKAEIHLLVRETLEAKTEADADRQLRELDLKLESVGNAVSAKATFRRSVRWSWQPWPPLGLSFEIEVPPHCQVRLMTRHGALTVPAMQGQIDARTQVGDVFVGAIDGSVTAISEEGSVTVAACTQTLSVEARNGNILVGRTEGPAEIVGISGNVEIQSSHGNLRVHGDGADLKVGFAYPLRGDADVRSSGGEIEASFETSVAAEIDARASTFGQVSLRDLDLKLSTGHAGSAHITGVLNQGGHRVLLNASGSDVHLRGLAPLPHF